MHISLLLTSYLLEFDHMATSWQEKLKSIVSGRAVLRTLTRRKKEEMHIEALLQSILLAFQVSVHTIFFPRVEHIQLLPIDDSKSQQMNKIQDLWVTCSSLHQVGCFLIWLPIIQHYASYFLYPIPIAAQIYNIHWSCLLGNYDKNSHL